MNRFIVLSSLCVGCVAFAADVVEAPRLVCKAMDRSGAVKVEAEGPSAAACLEAGHRKFAQACTEGGLVAVSWSMQGEEPVPCAPAKVREDTRLPPMGRVRCALAEKDGPRKVEALEPTAARCEQKVRRHLGMLCTDGQPIVARFTLTSTGDRLSCPAPERKASSH